MLKSKLNMSFRRLLLLICLISMVTISVPLYSQNDSNDLEVRPDDIVELSNGNRFVGKIILETNDFIKYSDLSMYLDHKLLDFLHVLC